MKKTKTLILVTLLCLFVLITGCENNKTTVEDKMIVSKDYRLPYFSFGSGEKSFVLLPGASMTSILASEDGVKALFEAYTDEYTAYVFDVPEDLDSIKSIDQLADCIADALKALGIKSADVYGASMGGMIAQKLAINHSELVGTLSLASSMSRNNDLSKKVISGWNSISDPKELAKDVNIHVYSEELYEAYKETFEVMENNATEDGVKRLHNLTRMILEYNSYDELDKIKCPVYVYTGSKDNTLGVEASKETAEKLNCNIKVYEGYSHAVYDEYPGFYDEVFSNINK